ncbi:MAG: sulfatase-like hydrolase/transferase [Kiritimatiellaeota bacterium]|nr:sulfatase-like hydrolase/transferase [Kiritimatiellota bacterium]
MKHTRLILLCASLGLLSGLAIAAPAKPNILIFLADDLGYNDCGMQGSKDIPTPGVRFTSGYTSGCVCSPTRAGLISGRYQQRFGFDANAEGKAQPTDKGPRALDIKQTTFAQRMKALGYATGIIGKWHIGEGEGYRPTDRGFDEFYGYFPFGIAAMGGNVPIYRGTNVVERPANHMEQFCKEACDFLDRHQKDAFLLYLPFSAVHGPYVGPEPWLAKFDNMVPLHRRKYAADVNQMDDIIGRVMARLRERGLEENTLVFFLGDNGGPGGAADNSPLRGTKWTVWEGGIRVPFAAACKGHIPAGRTLPQPVIQLDIQATAVCAGGGTLPTDGTLDGANLLPLLEGKTEAAPHDALYWRFGIQYAVRQGDWKLVKPHINDQPHLFNLASDIGEKNDLAAQEPERVKKLQALWDDWNAKNETPRWIDNRWDGRGPDGHKAGKGKNKAGGKAKAK